MCHAERRSRDRLRVSVRLMAQPNIGQIISDVWDDLMRTTEDPFMSGYDIFAHLFGARRRTYREILDRTRRNHYGDVIPRIVTIRRNLMRLGPTRLSASRLPL